jgi:DNA-binding HxlR family transcriptional regulator
MRRLNPTELELLLSVADKPRVIDKAMHQEHFNNLTERGYIKRTPVDPLKVEYTITRLGKATIAGIAEADSEFRRWRRLGT